MPSRIVGHVAALYRYPCKSMRGESISNAGVWWHGLEGDRRYAFVRADNRSRFPWLTAREVPQLLLYYPTFEHLEDPVNSPIRVTTPGGIELPIDSPDLRIELEELAGERLYLLQLGRGAFDSTAISTISTATLSSLSSYVSAAREPQRFRANILVDVSNTQPFPEDAWIGALLAFSARPDAARVRTIRPIQRCMVINLDPHTAHQEPAVLRTTVEQHDQCAGVYGVLEQIGTIYVGDPLILWHN